MIDHRHLFPLTDSPPDHSRGKAKRDRDEEEENSARIGYIMRHERI